jgi:thymidylate kinase
MSRNIIIGFDGLVRAGKTSLINKLANKLNATIIDEYKGYAYKAGFRFPKFPPKSYKRAIISSIFFMNVEKERVADLNKLIKKHKKIILVDRTCLSCIAFDYAANHFTNLDTFSEVQKRWSGVTRIIPNLIFFMDVSQENLKKRAIANNDVFPSHFFDSKFNGYMVEFFKQECERNKNIIRIDANQSPKIIEKHIESYIKEYLTRH